MKNHRPPPKARKPRPPGAPLELLDEAAACCQNLATIGELLAAARTDLQDTLEAETVDHTGHLVAQEAAKLKTIIHRLGGM